MPPYNDDAFAQAKAKARNGNGRAQRFTLVPFDAIELGTDPPYLVRGIFPREGIAVIWGPPKCGKTFWCFDIAMHVALGWEYRGHAVERGVVVYIAAEGERGFRARALAFRQECLSDSTERPDFYLIATRLSLALEVDALIADIRATIGDSSPVLIMIDTLNKTIIGSESNDEDMRHYVDAADKLREAFGALVAIIHHCGTDSTRPHGHTSLTGAADAQIAIKRSTSGTVTTEIEWLKDGEEGEILQSRLRRVEIGLDAMGDPITSCVVEPVDGDAPTVRKTRLPAQQARALDLLIDAIARDGAIPPAGNHIPANTQCVRDDLWRRYCYQGGISTGDQDAKQKAFKRASETLIAAGRVGFWSGWVWPV
jgi:hypothetical protein